MTLADSIGAQNEKITLTSGRDLYQDGGVLVINGIDSNGNLTPLKREYISFNGIMGDLTLTGVTRGLGDSTAQAHPAGADVSWASRPYPSLTELEEMLPENILKRMLGKLL